MNYEDLVGLIFSKGDKAKNTAFWSEISTWLLLPRCTAFIPRCPAAAVPLRPIIAVYHHIRRIYHPCSRLGLWSPEENEALIQ